MEEAFRYFEFELCSLLRLLRGGKPILSVMERRGREVLKLLCGRCGCRCSCHLAGGSSLRFLRADFPDSINKFARVAFCSTSVPFGSVSYQDIHVNETRHPRIGSIFLKRLPALSNINAAGTSICLNLPAFSLPFYAFSGLYKISVGKHTQHAQHSLAGGEKAVQYTAGLLATALLCTCATTCKRPAKRWAPLTLVLPWMDINL